ncbi:GntR family transcriptional regulator [Aestuariicoccus sp. MJ-SS9]|uniref:GntR family transcriptional regulator n=1 Tax=Aestuariicoccus sp. MJ-SS9 TaxID=3079855 RepID=UPI002906EF4F|nr:GntR family transcriptional regulator [Aestuariicoccus sp. MJ-SS9]MDU8913829.1 GntR family transcriptional regulator [Aestuariicoccus sp. MJ-SS9]
MIFGRRKSEDDTVVDMLAAVIRRDISFGVLRPDQKLKIDALRQSYGGSNHSMRETLRMLSAEGLVEATSQRGFRVTSATEDDLRDILLMRLETERLGLRRSLAAGDVAWESRVVAALHALTRAEAQVQDTPDDVTALAWDEACRALAEALISACGSPRLIEMADKFYGQSRRFRLALLREGRVDFAGRRTRQDQLREAILARDEQTALRLLEEDIRADIGR